MNKNDKRGRGVGILFLLGFSGALAAAYTKPLLNAPDFLVQISKDEMQLIFGAFFMLVMGFACGGIGMLLHSTLAKYDNRLAMGVAGFRIIEGVLQIWSYIYLTYMAIKNCTKSRLTFFF